MNEKKIRARLKVLIIAEAANPEWVSVPLVGWSLAMALRDVADVHIITQVRNRDAFLRAGLVEGQDFTAINSEKIARPLWRLAETLKMGWTAKTAISGLSYLYFERKVWQQFGAQIGDGEYDLVHRITPLSPTAQSPIAAKCARAGVPFVMGPLNGGVPWPSGFDGERRREREWLSYVRSAYKLMPGRRKSLNAAAAIITGSRHTQSEIPSYLQDRTIYIPENGIDPKRFNKRSTQDISGPLRACFIGRLVPYKGPDMLLEAAGPALYEGRLILDIIGDGPMRNRLEAQVQQAGLEKSVTFHGMLDHHAVQDIAAQSNLLTFPSIREFGGGVVIEAMSLGVVPLIVDYAGPGELVGPKTGFKVPIGTRSEIVATFGAQLEAILADPSALPDMGAACRTYVQSKFTWEAKAAQILDVYNWVLADRSTPTPDFF